MQSDITPVVLTNPPAAIENKEDEPNESLYTTAIEPSLIDTTVDNSQSQILNDSLYAPEETQKL